VLFCLHPIAPTIYMGNWALIAFIIVTKFLSNHHPFLLETIGANNFGPLPLDGHLKLAWELFLLFVVACTPLFISL